MAPLKYKILSAALFVSMIASAQSITITGKISDNDGQPLPGAAVSIKGTTRGTSANVNGEYTINATVDAILEYFFTGFKTISMPVGGRAKIDVTLYEEEIILDETVVVGYGTQKKVNITGSVATTNYEELSKSRPITTAASVLSGMNAGVMVRQTSSNPGSEGIDIRIRGVGTLNSASPLVIVDGFEGSMGNVNPDDIESISILKDAASCAIYGNRGANGVILVTTKTGGRDGTLSAGKFSVSYSGQFAINSPANKFKLVSDYADYMSIINESAENVGNPAIFSQTMIDLWREKSKVPNERADSGYPNYVAYPNTDWVAAMFNQKLYQKHNISASGAIGGTNYLISASYMDNPGIVDNTGYKRFQLRTNVSSWVTKWLQIGTKIWGHFGNRWKIHSQMTP